MYMGSSVIEDIHTLRLRINMPIEDTLLLPIWRNKSWSQKTI